MPPSQCIELTPLREGSGRWLDKPEIMVGPQDAELKTP